MLVDNLFCVVRGGAGCFTTATESGPRALLFALNESKFTVMALFEFCLLLMLSSALCSHAQAKCEESDVISVLLRP